MAIDDEIATGGRIGKWHKVDLPHNVTRGPNTYAGMTVLSKFPKYIKEIILPDIKTEALLVRRCAIIKYERPDGVRFSVGPGYWPPETGDRVHNNQRDDGEVVDRYSVHRVHATLSLVHGMAMAMLEDAKMAQFLLQMMQLV
jgi:hypothetical protein